MWPSVKSKGGSSMHYKPLLISLLCLLAGGTFTNAREARYVTGSKPAPKGAYCTLCHIGMTAFLSVYRSSTKSREELADIGINLCLQFNLQTELVCTGLIQSYKESVGYILDSNPSISPDQICGLLLHHYNCGSDEETTADWSVDLGNISQPEAKPALPSKSAPITVVHLTDLHYDPSYAVGSSAVCEEPICCRATTEKATADAAKAGRWGDYRGCDMPWDAITDAFNQIKTQHKHIDYIYMTGDLVDHGIWETSEENNTRTFTKILKEIKSTFGDIPVFPCLGNHDTYPPNTFAPVSVTNASVSSHQLYSTSYDLWSAWLPEETRETVLRGGFYTVAVRPGFRVVALNNNHCNRYNFWLLHQHDDPDGQLRWLVEVLGRAEAEGEKVHLLYHIPSGNTECVRTWSREFNRIVKRFSNTITGQFSGHSHFDEFQIFYSDDEPPRAINVHINGASLTPFQNVNPNYKVYHIDGDNFNLVDIDTWIYNLTAANLNPGRNPEWFKLYSFRDAFQLESLGPDQFDKLVHRLVEDKQLFRKFHSYYYLQADTKVSSECDNQCQEKLLCDLVTSNSGDWRQCHKIIGEYRDKHRVIQRIPKRKPRTV